MRLPGVTVNAVAPGCVEARLAASLPPEERARYVGATPGCFSAREEVAVAVGFLAGGGASFANGAMVEVNGGWHMA